MNILVTSIIVILAVIIFFWQVSNLISIIFGSPTIMMDKKVIVKALRLSGLKKGDKFYDLGCGNGDVLIEAAKLGAKATGFEISPFYFLLAKVRIFFWRYKNLRYNSDRAYSVKKGKNKLEIKIYFRNIFKANLSKADIVYCYLLPKILSKIKFHKNNRIISVGFPIKSFKPIRTKIIQNHIIFIYR